MEKSQSVNFNFASRANKLRTQKQAAIVRERELKQSQMTKNQYWNQYVRTKEDVIKYYEIYHPDYPTELTIAIANRLENLLYKYNDRDGRKNLTEDEKKMITYFAEPVEPSVWDPVNDIENQKLEGKINLASKRLEQLIAE